MSSRFKDKFSGNLRRKTERRRRDSSGATIQNGGEIVKRKLTSTKELAEYAFSQMKNNDEKCGTVPFPNMEPKMSLRSTLRTQNSFPFFSPLFSHRGSLQSWCMPGLDPRIAISFHSIRSLNLEFSLSPTHRSLSRSHIYFCRETMGLPRTLLDFSPSSLPFLGCVHKTFWYLSLESILPRPLLLFLPRLWCEQHNNNKRDQNPGTSDPNHFPSTWQIAGEIPLISRICSSVASSVSRMGGVGNVPMMTYTSKKMTTSMTYEHRCRARGLRSKAATKKRGENSSL